MAWQDKCSSWRSRLAASRHDDVLNDAEFSVGVYGVSVRANRAILAFASPVMKALFYGPLSANHKNIIPINDEMGTVRGFMAMIDFIYDEDKYSIKDLLEGKEEIGTSEDLAQVMELLYFADKYQIKSLISFCRNILIHKIKLNRGNMLSMYEVICKYNVLDVDYRIVTAQIKAFEFAVVDIDMLNNHPIIIHQISALGSQTCINSSSKLTRMLCFCLIKINIIWNMKFLFFVIVVHPKNSMNPTIKAFHGDPKMALEKLLKADKSARQNSMQKQTWKILFSLKYATIGDTELATAIRLSRLMVFPTLMKCIVENSKQMTSKLKLLK